MPASRSRKLKRSYDSAAVRRFDDGMLNVERKSGKYYKMLVDICMASASLQVKVLTFCSLQRNALRSPLLRLPREIRDMIWELVLGGNTFWIPRLTGIPINENCDEEACGDFKISNGLHHCLALLQSCRQVYAEAALFPYWFNVFQVCDVSELATRSFSGNHFSKHVRTIEFVGLDYEHSCSGQWVSALIWMRLNARFWLPRLPSLETVIIHCIRANRREHDKEPFLRYMRKQYEQIEIIFKE